jgi:hypothetical protein
MLTNLKMKMAYFPKQQVITLLLLCLITVSTTMTDDEGNNDADSTKILVADYRFLRSPVFALLVS